jgi:hypothetical protein
VNLVRTVGVEATPWRATHGVSDYIKGLAVDVRVIEPRANPQYIGIAVEGNPQEHNPHRVEFRELEPPAAQRRPTDHEMRLDWLVRKGYVTRNTDGTLQKRANGTVDVTGPFSVTEATAGSVTNGEVAVKLSVGLGAQLRIDKDHLGAGMAHPKSAFSKCVKKREPLTMELRREHNRKCSGTRSPLRHHQTQVPGLRPLTPLDAFSRQSSIALWSQPITKSERAGLRARISHGMSLCTQ